MIEPSRPEFRVILLALILSACAPGFDSGDQVARPPAPRVSAQEAQAIALRFDELAREMERMVLPPASISNAERRRLRLAMDDLVEYLEARDWREERIVQLRRERWEVQQSQGGVYDGDRETYGRMHEAYLASLERIDAEIHRLRSLPGATVDSEAPPPIELPSAAAGRGDGTTGGPRVYGEPIAAMEALLLPPGRIHPETKSELRRRLQPLLAFLDVPLSRAEQIDALKAQLAALPRFHRVPPVDGAHDLYARYRQAIEAEAAQLRERIRRLEATAAE